MRIKLGIPLALSEIASSLKICLNIEEKVYFLSTDTRECCRGDLFISLSQDVMEMERHTKEALNRGAYALSLSKNATLCVKSTVKALGTIAKLYLTKLKYLKYKIAITGSVGKTTTKEFIGTLISKSFVTHVSIGNFNNEIGCPLSVLSAPFDTEVLVLELGMNHFGEVERLSRIINPDIGIITNIGTAHIGNLGSRENIAKAKSEISIGMNEGFILCPANESLLSSLANRRSLSIEDNDSADYRISNIRRVGLGYVVDFIYKSGVIPDITFNNIGEHLLWALGYSLAVGLYLGINEGELRSMCQNIGEDNLRHRYTPHKDILLLDDSYNCSLESLSAAIKMLKERCVSYSFALGDILECGDMRKEIHEKMGAMAGAAKPNRIYYMGDNFESFVTGVKSSGFNSELVTHCQTGDFLVMAKIIWENHAARETVLFKASRRIGLENVVALLKEM